MRNDSTGQFEDGECLEGASSLSAAQFEGTGLLQHGSYAIGCKRKNRKNNLILEANTKRRILYHAQVIDLYCGKHNYLIENEKTRLMKVTYLLTDLVT